jgi:hypothetical protein
MLRLSDNKVRKAGFWKDFCLSGFLLLENFNNLVLGYFNIRWLWISIPKK